LTDNRPEPEGWPVAEGDTLLLQRTREAPAPPPPVAPGPPPPDPDRRIGAGMLLALTAIVLALAGVAIAYFATHRDSRGGVTTVVLNTGRSTPTTAKRPKAKPIAGTTKVAVPDLRGKSLADARAALSALGFSAATTPVTSTQPAGTVVDQAPKAGAKLAKGSSITLSVARSQTATAPQSTSTPTTTAAATPPPPQNATMPDVTTQTEAAAVQALNRAGILASLFFVPGQDPLGTVEQQAKPAGATVPAHAHVQINVSSGPGDKPKVGVPNVIGQTLQQALSSLNGAHLRLIFVKVPVTSRTQAGKVVQQSPLGGGQAPQNAQVAVFLGAYRS